jgi:exodeoxyribonuclease VII small subunit
MSKAAEKINFEESFARLEVILDKMNSGKVTLDESLALYEEADKLISACTLKLNAAENRIEMLIKKRNGELELDENDKPQSQDFKIQE